MFLEYYKRVPFLNPKIQEAQKIVDEARHERDHFDQLVLEARMEAQDEEIRKLNERVDALLILHDTQRNQSSGGGSS